jgi:hypothetical protein
VVEKSKTDPAKDRSGNALLMQTQIFASRTRKRAREKSLSFFRLNSSV